MIQVLLVCTLIASSYAIGFLERENLEAVKLQNMIGSEYIGRGYNPNFNIGIRDIDNYLDGLDLQQVVKLNYSANIEFNGFYNQKYSCPKGIICKNYTAYGDNDQQYDFYTIQDLYQLVNINNINTTDNKDSGKEYSGFRNNAYTQSLIDGMLQSNQSFHYIHNDSIAYQISLNINSFELHPWFVGNVTNLSADQTQLNNSKVIDQYQKFIKSFGTHYIQKYKLGGRYTFMKKVQIDSTFNNTELISNLTHDDYTRSKVHNYSESELTQTDTKTRLKYDEYSSKISQNYMGGNPFILDKWLESIPWTPIPLQMNIQSIANLLDQQYFNLPNIDKQQKMFLYFVSLTNNQTSITNCYNNCSNNGYCQDSGIFKIGECMCFNGFGGPDCSVKQNIN